MMTGGNSPWSERRRSSKPLEISPSIVNDEVTSGTADTLKLAVAVESLEKPLMSSKASPQTKEGLPIDDF